MARPHRMEGAEGEGERERDREHQRRQPPPDEPGERSARRDGRTADGRAGGVVGASNSRRSYSGPERERGCGHVEWARQHVDRIGQQRVTDARRRDGCTAHGEAGLGPRDDLLPPDAVGEVAIPVVDRTRR